MVITNKEELLALSQSDPILTVHHIRPRTDGGSDRPANLVTLCRACHHQHHNGHPLNGMDFPLNLKAPQDLRDATQFNVIKAYVMRATTYLQRGVTFGHITKARRMALGLPKSHLHDAFVIAGGQAHFRAQIVYLGVFARRQNRKLFKGVRSQLRNTIPSAKGFRRGDRVQLADGRHGFIFGLRSSGHFDVRRLDGTILSHSISYKALRRVEGARTRWIERSTIASIQAKERRSPWSPRRRFLMRTQTSEDILADVRKILGQEIRITKRNWAVYWCPSHLYESQKGSTGEPNFGVDLNTGRYNCFRCSFKGGSLKSLAKAVGAEYASKNVEFIKRRPKRDVNNGYDVSHVVEAIADSQGRLLKSAAMSYLKHRGVTPYTAMVYGLGYAVGTPYISRGTAKAGYKLGLITRGGTWLWQESIMYADPVSDPKVLNVRYLPDQYMKQPRDFQLGKHPHRTWGERSTPLGAWRITPRTRGVVIVEGLFDMLVGAQCLDERRLYPEHVCVYTNGASPSFEILDWFAEHDYDYFLIRDMDKAGADWVEMITTALCDKETQVHGIVSSQWIGSG